MLSARAFRGWYLVHKWTSLVCTLFLLLLCVTGLPLIFFHEIDHWTGRHAEPADVAADAPPAPVDAIVAAAVARHPGDVPLFVFFDEEEPLVGVTSGASPDVPDEELHFAWFDARTAEHRDAPPFDEGVMYVLWKLHVDLFVGLPGTLFLGFMGLLLLASLVSGVVVYGPFMRKLEFGALRKGRTPRLRWLDLHNLLGIATLCWAFVVGATGVINALADPLQELWQRGQLAELVREYADASPPARLVSVDLAIGNAVRAGLDLEPSFIAFPGTDFSSPHHYAVYMRGKTPLAGVLLKPALVDAETGSLTAFADVPWYIVLLQAAGPLHFGDYGGMPLKVVWALLDLIVIAVLASGVYLWVARPEPA